MLCLVVSKATRSYPSVSFRQQTRHKIVQLDVVRERIPEYLDIVSENVFVQFDLLSLTSIFSFEN